MTGGKGVEKGKEGHGREGRVKGMVKGADVNKGRRQTRMEEKRDAGTMKGRGREEGKDRRMREVEKY